MKNSLPAARQISTSGQRPQAARRSVSLSPLCAALGLVLFSLSPVALAGELDREPAPVSGAMPSTREQVRAERVDAQRRGESVTSETGQTAREANPKRYPPVAKPQGKTRQQVKAETSAAIRTGEMTDAESGKKLNELNPKRYEKARQAEGPPASASR